VFLLSNLFAQLQTSIAQKKSHIQIAQKQIAQLHHALTLMNEQGYLISDLQGLYGPFIQKCIQSHIHGNTLPDIKKAFIKATEEKAKKVMEIFISLYTTSYMAAQHPSTHGFEEKVGMKKIEKTLLD
jgi:predicted Ser/Thr protein kinase